jgi:AraC-like DNA-binding protein
MDVENLPPIATPDHGSVQDPDRPILSYAWQGQGPHRAAAHRHPRAQIIHPTSGAYWVITPEGTWLVPSSQAIWVPPFVHHEVYSHGTVSAMMLFVDAAFADRLPQRAGAVEASPLLVELLRRMVDHGNDYQPGGPPARLAQVLLDELASLKTTNLFLPVSKDPRLTRVMQELIEKPDSQENLETLAKRSGASLRTLARLFKSETGMTFAQWKTRLVLVESIDRLNRGASITEVALDLGYSTTSAFVYMFRTNLGVSPGRYRRSG